MPLRQQKYKKHIPGFSQKRVRFTHLQKSQKHLRCWMLDVINHSEEVEDVGCVVGGLV